MEITQTNAFGEDDPVQEDTRDQDIALANSRRIRMLSEEIIETLKSLWTKISLEYCKHHGVVEHSIVFSCKRCEAEQAEITKIFNEEGK